MTKLSLILAFAILLSAGLVGVVSAAENVPGRINYIGNDTSFLYTNISFSGNSSNMSRVVVNSVIFSSGKYIPVKLDLFMIHSSTSVYSTVDYSAQYYSGWYTKGNQTQYVNGYMYLVKQKPQNIYSAGSMTGPVRFSFGNFW